MPLSDTQRALFEKLLAESQADILDCDRQIKEQHELISERLSILYASKLNSKKIYAAACKRLGIEQEPEESDFKCDYLK